MVTCERCHRKFSSYTALLQHYKTKHRNITNLSELESKVSSEKENASITASSSMRAHGPSKIKLAAFLIIVIIAIGVIGYVASTPKAPQAAKKLSVGSVAPDFTLPSVGGGMFTLSSLKGQANVLLYFSEGLACSPCMQQARDFDQANSQFADLNVIIVSITGDSLTLLANWAQSNGPKSGKFLSDQSLAVSKAYDMLGSDISMMPGTAPGHSFILVDKSGIVKWRQDYGPNNMYVPNNQIVTAVRRALG